MFSQSNLAKNINLKTIVGFGAAVAVSLYAAKLLMRTKKRKKITRLIDTIEELQKSTVKIKDRERVEDIVCHLIKSGASKLQVIMDFDQTITRMHFNGTKCASTYCILDSSPMITDDYRNEAKKLHDKYYAIEIDPYMTIEEKIPHMVEWYTKSHSLLKDSGIHRDDLGKMVKLSNAFLRDGCDTLFQTLNAHDVPLLIFSAGIGDVVEEVLKFNDAIYPNMKFVSNYMEFDKDGNVTGFKGDLIHMFNKNENSIQNGDYFTKLRGKCNVVLVGDSLGDLGMCCGAEQPECVLKIGFLNEKIDERMSHYMDGYDIVLVDDQTVDVLNGLLRRIL